MRVLAIVHQSDAGPGVFADAVRGAGAELVTWPVAEVAEPPDDPLSYDAVLTFGGAMHVDQEGAHPWLAGEKALLRSLIDRGVPLLGVCLGAQLIAEAVGATPQRLPAPEIGWYEVELTADGLRDPVLGPLGRRFDALQWHSYECPLPAGATPLARSRACLQAFLVGDAAWGVQFHAEVTAADFDTWLADYRSDEDAVAAGLDPEAVRRRTRPRMPAWNELGRELCERFVLCAREAARARSAGCGRPRRAGAGGTP